MAAPSDSTEQLLAHSGWVRRLAHHMVRDPELAEDLVQDTWVAALRHPPRGESVASTRAFLGRILRNSWLQKARSERHRRAREEMHAKSELGPPDAGLVEEVDSHRLLLEEVLKLGEPARRTILLRYFREQSAAEIASAEGIPPATVRSRLKRALEELRERLDARHGGDRSAWSLGVFAWAHHVSTAPAPASPVLLGATAALEGVLVMKAVKIALFAGVTVLAAYGVSRFQRTPAGAAAPETPAFVPQEVAGPEPMREPPMPAALEVAPEEEEDQRVALAPAIETAPTPVAPPERHAEAFPSTVTALFVDPGGIPVPGVEFRFERIAGRTERTGVVSSVSGAGGFAALDLRLEQGRNFGVFNWRAEGYQLGGIEAELVVGGTTDLGTLTIEGGTPVTGRVVDPSGRPVADARVWAGGPDIPDGDAGQIERRGPMTVIRGALESDSTPTVGTAADGSFRIPGVAQGGARVWAHATGTRYCVSRRFDVVAGTETQGVEVVLVPLAPEDRIAGIVIDEEGAPVPRAQILYALHDRGFGMSSYLSADDEGRFELVLWRQTPHSFTVTESEGTSKAHAARVEPGTLDLVLQLGQQDTYELVVRDLDGEPIEEYEVTTCLGTEDSWTGRVERGEEHPGGRMEIGKPEDSFWIDVRAVGYALGKLGPYERGEVPDVLELTLEPAPVLSGRVFSSGEPIAGARVELYRAIDDDTFLEVNGFPAFWRNTGEVAKSDADGEYVLQPREDGEFVVRATLEGHAPGESLPLRLAVSTGALDVDIHLGAGGTLAVQVVAPPGQDAAGVVVAITRGDGHPRTKRTGADGRAVFEQVTPGTWDVRTTDEELKPFMTYSTSADLEPGMTRPERPRDVEVHEGRTSSYTLVLEDEPEKDRLESGSSTFKTD